MTRLHVRVSMRTGPETAPLNRGRYIVPCDLHVAGILQKLRKRMRLRPEEALFLLTTDGRLLSPQDVLRDVHAKHADDHGVLHLMCSKESVFG